MEIVEGWAALPTSLPAGRDVPLNMLIRNAQRPNPRPRRVRHEPEVGYNWEQDFPLFARERKGGQRSTVVHLEFELDSSEQEAFREETGISINQKLPIQVSLKERSATLSIPKSGRGSHKEKAREIAKFLTNRIRVLHIPAVRTGSTALGIADEILSSRRRKLLRTPEYAALVDQIAKLDQEVVEDVESVLQETLVRFIPGTKTVRLEARSLSRMSGLDDILIDDGVLTSIATKGDGIQSLVALALTMEWTQSTSHPDKQLLIAVEEPESHLHPGAVHELRQVLQGIAKSQQVIVTTHSQSLVNRRNIKRNVIVSDRGATPAKNLSMLRESLGVRLSDALTSAEVVVVGEGHLDEVLLPELLAQRNPDVKDWIAEGRLVFESAGSGSKIYSRVLAAQAILAYPIVVVDSDPAGNKDVQKLLDDAVISQTDIVQIVRPKCVHSELEDLLLQSVYLEAVEKRIGFSLNERQRKKLDRGHDLAWSDRLADLLKSAGVPDPSNLVKGAKFDATHAAIAAIGKGETVVREGCEDLLDRLNSLISQVLTSR